MCVLLGSVVDIFSYKPVLADILSSSLQNHIAHLCGCFTFWYPMRQVEFGPPQCLDSVRQTSMQLCRPLTFLFFVEVTDMCAVIPMNPELGNQSIVLSSGLRIDWIPFSED